MPKRVTLLSAPRILNAPVRCKFSAFRTILPPVSSPRYADGVTGVCSTVPAPTARARRVFSNVISTASLFFAKLRVRQLPREHPAQWPTLDGIDLVPLLGSEWSVYWGNAAKIIEAESELIRETHRQGMRFSNMSTFLGEPQFEPRSGECLAFVV